MLYHAALVQFGRHLELFTVLCCVVCGVWEGGIIRSRRARKCCGNLAPPSETRRPAKCLATTDWQHFRKDSSNHQRT